MICQIVKKVKLYSDNQLYKASQARQPGGYRLWIYRWTFCGFDPGTAPIASPYPIYHFINHCLNVPTCACARACSCCTYLCMCKSLFLHYLPVHVQGPAPVVPTCACARACSCWNFLIMSLSLYSCNRSHDSRLSVHARLMIWGIYDRSIEC